jgi:uncharacterized protein YkwD
MAARSTLTRRALAVAAMAVLSTMAFAPPASADHATVKEKALRRKINDYRANNGASKLKMSDPLVTKARKHARDMASDNRFDPVNDHSSRTQLANYADAGNCDTNPVLAELIASTKGTNDHTVNQLLTQWKNSPTHDAALLNRDWETIGTGIHKDSNDVLWGTVLLCSTR